MTDTCQPTNQNLAFYLQGVSVEPSLNITYDYLTTASLPSSAPTRRVWQFQAQGTLTGPSSLILDYTAAHVKCPKFNITFEGALNGTFIIHNQTFSANRFISYRLLSTYVLELTLRVPKAITECYGLGTTQNYYFSINLNDATICSYNICLTYGTDSSGTDYDYIAGTPDTLSVVSSPAGGFSFVYQSITDGNIVDVSLETSANTQIYSNYADLNNETSISLQPATNDTQQIMIIYSTLSTFFTGWGLYFQYDEPLLTATNTPIELSSNPPPPPQQPPTPTSITISALQYDKNDTSGYTLSCTIVPSIGSPTICFVVADALTNDELILSLECNSHPDSSSPLVYVYDGTFQDTPYETTLDTTSTLITLQYNSSAGWNNVGSS